MPIRWEKNTGNHTEKISRVRNTRIVASDPDFRCSGGEFGAGETIFFLTITYERSHMFTTLHIWPRSRLVVQEKVASHTPDSPPLHLKSGSEATILVFRTRRIFSLWLPVFSSHLIGIDPPRSKKRDVFCVNIWLFPQVPNYLGISQFPRFPQCSQNIRKTW